MALPGRGGRRAVAAPSLGPGAAGAGGRDRGSARLRVGLGVAGPATLAALLPRPADLVTQVGEGSDAVTVLGAAILLAVTVLVWGLLAWAALVTGAAVLTRMPGVAGRLGRTALRVLAPAAARRVLIVAAGVCMVTGASACATSVVSGGGPAGYQVTAAMDAGGMLAGTAGPAYVDGGYAGPAGSSSAAAPPGGGAATGHGATIDLDWPVPESTSGTAAAPVTTPPTVSPTGQAATAAGTAPIGPPSVAPTGPAAAAAGTALAGRPPVAGTAPATGTAHHGTATPANPRQSSPAGGPRAHPATTVTVRPGDSLWAIAARHLPADATDAQIDAAWRHWYAANRAEIGPDPGLILPGQRLVPPDASHGAS